MKPNTKIAIAALLSAAGAVLTAFANEFGGTAPAAEPAADPTPEPTPKATKKPKAEKPAPAPEPEPEAEEETEAPASGKTYDDMRALIKPLVENGQGAEVKKVIAKYSPEGGLKAMDPKDYAAFEKDVIALSY